MLKEQLLTIKKGKGRVKLLIQPLVNTEQQYLIVFRILMNTKIKMMDVRSVNGTEKVAIYM